MSFNSVVGNGENDGGKEDLVVLGMLRGCVPGFGREDVGEEEDDAEHKNDRSPQVPSQREGDEEGDEGTQGADETTAPEESGGFIGEEIHGGRRTDQ